MKVLTKWSAPAIILVSAASVLKCQLKFGLGQTDSDELFHTTKAV